MTTDTYENFDALKKAARRGIDYDIKHRTVPGASVIILAPHGGTIEPYTEGVADTIAGEDFSYYAFVGLNAPGPRLHITSTRFDEPLGVAMVAAHQHALAVHGWAAAGEQLSIGGRDGRFGAALKASLTAAGIKVGLAPPELNGTDLNNIANRCGSSCGTQLELTMALRRNTEKIAAVIRAVRYMLKNHPSPDQPQCA